MVKNGKFCVKRITTIRKFCVLFLSAVLTLILVFLLKFPAAHSLAENQSAVFLAAGVSSLQADLPEKRPCPEKEAAGLVHKEDFSSLVHSDLGPAPARRCGLTGSQCGFFFCFGF